MHSALRTLAGCNFGRSRTKGSGAETRNFSSIPFGANFDPRNADPTNPRVPLPPSFLRRYSGYGDINLKEPAGSSNYHSLPVSANRRFTRGLEFGAFWTWSKAMDFADSQGTVVSNLLSRRLWNYGLAGFDRTHVVKINWLWDAPKSRLKWVAAKATTGRSMESAASSVALHWV